MLSDAPIRHQIRRRQISNNPAYIFTAATLIVTVWALMTWPWERATIGAATREGR